MKLKKLLAMILVLLFSAACFGGKVFPAVHEAETTEAASESGSIETNFFSLVYNEPWTFDESKDLRDKDSSSYLKLRMYNPEDSSKQLAYLEIDLKLNEPADFAKTLIKAGLDPQKLITGEESAETRSIGGVDFWVYKQGSRITYYGYLAEQNAFVSVLLSDTKQMDKTDAVIDSICFTAQPYSGVATPWYWEGTPFEGGELEAEVDTVKLSGKWLPLDESCVVWDVFSPRIAAVGDKMYILVDKTLNQYSFDGSALSFDMSLDVGAGYDNVQVGPDGSLWLSGFGKSLINVKDGEAVASYSNVDKVCMAPSCTWGISYFTKAECEKLTINDGEAVHEAIAFPELKVISAICLDENRIYVCGNSPEDNNHKIFVYDPDGKLQLVLTDNEGKSLGSITYVTETENGFIAMDGNMRKTVLWAPDGTWMAKIDDAELFGTSYPWFAGSSKLADGSILTVMVEERPDKSADELLVFVLSGLCEDSAVSEDYPGKYLFMVGEAFGLTITVDDLAGWEISLNQDGKGSMAVDGESESLTYTIENGTITMDFEGEMLIGSIGGNMIKFENILDSGMDVIFGKEGTEAANPENYLTFDVRAMFG